MISLAGLLLRLNQDTIPPVAGSEMTFMWRKLHFEGHCEFRIMSDVEHFYISSMIYS